MLEEFRVDNYKSLINVTFNPGDLNLLLGRNNSGKTNLCQAMRFVGSSTIWSLDRCADTIAGSRVGMTNHFFDKPTTDFYVRASLPFRGETLIFEYDLTIAYSSPQRPAMGSTLQVQNEKLIVTGEGFDGVALIQSTSEKTLLLNEKRPSRKLNYHIETTASQETTLLNRIYDSEMSPRAKAFRHYLSYWQYYDMSPSALRSSSHSPNTTILNHDGSNLASAIYRLKTSDERRYRKLIKCIQKFDASIDLINFQVASESHVFMVFEDAHGHSLWASNASNGTLRFLGLAYVLLAQPTQGTHPLVIIEEPENGIYVSVLKDLIDMATESSDGPQLIFTTHSPYFIDLFDERLDNIFLFERGEQHSSIHQPNPDKIKSRLGEFPLGEQHFREMLQ